MILLLLICSLATVAVAQEPFLSCIYYTFGPTDYNCQLIINNPNGLNNFTGIDGIHLEGFTNDDVDTVYIGNGFTTNIPQIICETFPNLYEIDFFNAGLTGIDDTAFSGCSQIGRLFLSYNRISSISENAFANNRNVSYIHLGDNLLTELSENLFANQQNLTDLILSYNFFTDIPAGLFRPLENLRNLYLGSINLTTINNQWFTGNSQLTYLYLGHNRITLSPNMFSGIVGLRAISLAFNELSEIPPGTFAGLPSLQTLDLYWNNFTALPADSFPGIDQLVNIDLSRNPIETIDANAFRGIESLQSLALESCSIRDLSSISLNLPNLTYVDFNFNSIEEIPSGFFESTPRLSYIGFWANSLKTLRRNSFGSLNALTTLDLDGNIVNAIDRSFIDDAVNLITFYFDDNLCASSYFGNFVANRARYLPMLERCFRNMRYIVEATTENDGVYSFFEGIQPGIVLRVRSDNEVQIALTPFDFIWTPAIEIFIGSSNNTRSVIRVNDDTNVVTVPTPNIIRPNQWNDFRISWANQNVLVYNSNDTFPFMSYTMQQFFPVNFYGLRAVETRATWSVQPIFVEDD